MLHPLVADKRQFAALHYFALVDGKPIGQTRPFLASRHLIVERPLRQQKRPFSTRHLTGTIDHVVLPQYRGRFR
jgi:hypothetical protein